jgi:hypothetical protein
VVEAAEDVGISDAAITARIAGPSAPSKAAPGAHDADEFIDTLEPGGGPRSEP